MPRIVINGGGSSHFRGVAMLGLVPLMGMTFQGKNNGVGICCAVGTFFLLGWSRGRFRISRDRVLPCELSKLRPTDKSTVLVADSSAETTFLHFVNHFGCSAVSKGVQDRVATFESSLRDGIGFQRNRGLKSTANLGPSLRDPILALHLLVASFLFELFEPFCGVLERAHETSSLPFSCRGFVRRPGPVSRRRGSPQCVAAFL